MYVQYVRPFSSTIRCKQKKACLSCSDLTFISELFVFLCTWTGLLVWFPWLQLDVCGIRNGIPWGSYLSLSPSPHQALLLTSLSSVFEIYILFRAAEFTG